jgi:hypothetical protein
MNMIVKTYQGADFLIDEEDYHYYQQHNWHIDDNGYVYRAKHVKRDNGTVFTKHIKYHREILILHGHDIEGKIVDHKNIDPSDNRKENLRYGITYGQSLQNQHRRKDNTSGYKGVNYRNTPYRKNWRARIKVEGKEIGLGFYYTAEEAAYAYDCAALKYYGEHAFINGVAKPENIKIPPKKKKVGVSGFYGVQYNARNKNHWRATISFNGKQKTIGFYETAVEAAIAYNKKVLELYGDEAELNVIPLEYKHLITA